MMDIKEVKTALLKIKSDRREDVNKFKSLTKVIASEGYTSERRAEVDALQQKIDGHDAAIADHEERIGCLEKASLMDDDDQGESDDTAGDLLESKSVRSAQTTGRKSLPTLPASQRDFADHNEYARRNNFSYAKVCKAVVSNRSVKDGVEAEINQQLSAINGAPQGVWAPLALRDLNKSTYEQRDLTLTTGAGAVPVLWSPDIIEYLYNYLVFAKLGVTFWSGDHQYQIPRLASTATQQVVAEEGSATPSNEVIDYIRLVPRTCTGNVTVSRKMLMQGSQNMEELIKKDLARTTAVQLEREGLVGNPSSNANENYGVLYDPNNTNVFTFAGGVPTWQQIVAMVSHVEQANVPVDGVGAYLTSPLGAEILQTSTKVTGGASTFPIYLADKNEMHGFPLVTTSTVPNTFAVSGQGSSNSALIFMAWDQLIFAQFSDGLDLIEDIYTQASSGSVRIVSLFDYDFGIRHSLAASYGLNLNVATA